MHQPFVDALLIRRSPIHTVTTILCQQPEDAPSFYLLTRLPTYSPAYLLARLPTCLPTHLPTYLLAYLPTCLPTYELTRRHQLAN